MLRGIGGLRPQRFHHSRVPGLLPGRPEAIVTLGAEMHGSVGPPHVITGWRRLVHRDNVVVARPASLCFTPPDGLVVEVVAPEQTSFRQAAVLAAPSRFEDGRAMIQPIHAESAAVRGPVAIAGDVAKIVAYRGTAYNRVTVIADQRLEHRRQARQRSAVSIKCRPKLCLGLHPVR